MNNEIKIIKLSKRFGKKEVLKDVNLTITKGKIIGLLGANGVGKTTLIKTIVGLYKKDKGHVMINGQEVGAGTHKYVSYMPDKIMLYEWMKVKDAINYYADMFSDFDIDKAKELCDVLKISVNDKINVLSTGMKERMMIMLTFSRKTAFYLLDEPIGGIDPVAKDIILKTIISNVEPNSTVLISTHLIKDVEHMLDEVIFIDNGEIKTHESADKIREQYGKSIDDFYLEVMKNA